MCQMAKSSEFTQLTNVYRTMFDEKRAEYHILLFNGSAAIFRKKPVFADHVDRRERNAHSTLARWWSHDTHRTTDDDDEAGSVTPKV